MILQLKLKNYRSYKEETVFSLEASTSDLKLDNLVDYSDEKQNCRVLKTAIIYGANASGKSNVIRALFELRKLIVHKPKVDDSIDLYEPFKFDVAQRAIPCEFELTFLGPERIKFLYKIKILNDIIIEEDLSYYPLGKITKVFSREKYNENNHVQKGILGDKFGKKELKVFPNQLILSKFGDDEPHELLTEVFLYFKFFEIINATNEKHTEFHLNQVSADLVSDANLKQRLSKLIRTADTKLKDITVFKLNDKDEKNNNLTVKNPFSIFGIHDLYSGDDIIATEQLPFSQESTGTQSLYMLGSKILRTLERGGVLIVDELDTSLHPFITKMIVMIFQSEVVNDKNAQLIFTTHDVSLLDRDLIRRDQVWLAEKDERGSSDLYSLQDFEGLREDTPFEKWYLAGKFGGLPQIQSVDSIFTEHEPIS